MGCKLEVYTLTNGEKSNLYKTIEGFSTSEEQAMDRYKYFINNQDFIKEFGDWKEDYTKNSFDRSMSKRVDDNGEPKLFYDDKVKKNYFVDKRNTKVYFPVSETKLEDIFTKARIKSISKALALNFFKERFNENFDEIDLSARKGTLRDSIIEKLSSKVTEFEDSDDFAQVGNAMLIQESLQSIDEWVREVQDYFLRLKLVHKESTETDDLMEAAESERGAEFGISSFEKSTKDNISSNIKLRLSLLVNNEELDETLLEPTFRDFDDVYSSLLTYVTDQVHLDNTDTFEEMMTSIHSLIGKKPYMLDLYNILNKSSEYLKAEFVQAFNLHKNNYIGSIYNSINIAKVETIDGVKQITHKKINTHTVQNFSSVGAKHSIVKNNWFYNFTKKFTNARGVVSKEGTAELLKIKKHYDTIFLDFNKKASKKGYYNNQNLPVDVFVRALGSLGIKTSEAGFNHYLDNLEAGALDFDQRLYNLKGLTSSIKYFLDDITDPKSKVDLTEGENILGKQVAFNNLARAEAFFLREGSDSSIFTVNKTKWVYSYPSYLSTKIKQWKANKQLLFDHYDTAYNRGSHFMKYLLALDVPKSEREKEATDRLNKFEINIFNSFQKEGDATNAVDNKEISKVDAFADAYHKLLGFRVKGKSTYIQTATPADKSTLIQIKTPDGMMLKTNPFMQEGIITTSEESKKILREYVKSEYERIKEVTKEIKAAKGDTTKLRSFYHLGPKNGLKFQLLTSLNYENFDAEKMGFELYTKAGTILQRLDFNETSIKNGLDTHIEQVLHNKIKDMYTHLQDIGLLERLENGKVVNKAFANDIWDSYDRNHALGIASDIVVNGLISQVEYSKMFAGDIAFYKNVTDYKKRIPATYTDGLQLYLKPGEEFYTATIIDDVVIATPFYENLKELIGEELASKYTAIDSTDAQAWITTARWKFLKEKLGQWSSAHDVVYDKMTGENKEPYTKEELKITAQPLKGVYFEINDGVPVYLKYSQAVLVPNLIKNSPELRKLHDLMVRDKSDEIITGQGIKVGAVEPLASHNADGTLKEGLKLNPMRLKNSGWKLQQDLPTKTFKQTDVGSQIQKNIYEALTSEVNLEALFQVGDKEMTGKDLIIYINSIVEELSDRGYEGFVEEFDITENGKINNTDKINKALIKELKQRGAPSNIVKALESGISPFGIPGYSQKLQNIFASITLDRIVKIKTNGGSFIQMSNYGINNTEADKKGVLWAPWAKSTAHEYEYVRDDEGNIMKSESGKDLIRPAGVLLTGSFVAKYVPDYKSKSLKEIFGTKEKNYKDGLIDKRILENIIGYRIPNQALASNDALEVVGILPEEMGDTIIAYTGITTKTGSDFDIDKMYLMFPNIRPDYKHKAKLRDYAYNYLRGKTLQESIDNVSKIVDQIGDDTVKINPNRLAKMLMSETKKGTLDFEIDNFVEAVLHKDTELTNYIKSFIKDYNKVEAIKYVSTNKDVANSSVDALQNKLIEAYKGALLNTNTIKAVMTPIDFPFIKDDIVALVPPTTIQDFDTFDLKKEIELKFEFNAGKAGVGITANALVDHIRGLMADISLDDDLGTFLMHNDIASGHTVFDEEYSQELTDKELEDYMKHINSSLPKDKQYTKKSIESLRKIKVSQSVSAYLNAFVDIAKDPYVTRGNWTTQTSNTGFMLLRAGMHPFYVNAILAQPIIGDYIDFTVNKESIIGNESGDIKSKFIKDLTREAFSKVPDFVDGALVINYEKLFNTLRGKVNINNLKKLYGSKVTLANTEVIAAKFMEVTDKFEEDKKSTKEVFKLDKLRKQLNKKDVDIQLEVFYKFIGWQQHSKKLVNNMNASKIDVNGYGKNTMEMIIAKNLMAKMMDKELGGIVNFESKLTFNGKKSLLGTYSHNILENVMTVMQANYDYFLTSHPVMVDTFNEVSMKLKQEILVDKKLGNKIDKSFNTYVMSGFTPFQMDASTKKQILRQTVREVNAIKEAKSSDNILLEEIDIKVGDLGQTFLSMNNRKKSVDEQELISNAWLDLFDENKELAEKLVKYSYLTSGFQMNMNQFYSYIPYEWFIDNGINEYTKEVSSLFTERGLDYNFIDQFFRHNIEDNQIVRSVFPSQIVEKYKKSFTGFLIEDGRITSPYLKRDYMDEQTMTSSTFLFKRIGLDEQGFAIYARVETLGTTVNGNKVFEYDLFNSNVDTIIQKGMIVQSQKDVIAPFYDMIVEDGGQQLEERTIDVEKVIKVEEKPTTIGTSKPTFKKVINIYAGTNENATLSNFANRPFKLGDDVTYPTVEHAFQLEKLQYSNAYTDGQIENIVKEQIKRTPSQVKAFGRTIKGLKVAEWEKGASIVMKEFIKESFRQNPKALTTLLETGDAILTHTQDRGKWGKLFPKILMEVRGELSNVKPEVKKPTIKENFQTEMDFSVPDTMDFNDMAGAEDVEDLLRRLGEIEDCE